jgi:hypothetical protein
MTEDGRVEVAAIDPVASIQAIGNPALEAELRTSSLLRIAIFLHDSRAKRRSKCA